ncbi:FAD-dependent monooxygenase [Streptomyces antimicrobicus]|uniref:FAD-dependent monooxygenase n=1 Tax=Streptomyces antimicrobicus TaxID=2883108 RepID=A0ABS8B1U1_9ACTN|nr:FAD-dependent monooxygenase [Streptomyces antimicrobicus]MCB5178576.1 FAD-dependent monooxygenase [Streptomyces antimicrobicus]
MPDGPGPGAGDRPRTRPALDADVCVVGAGPGGLALTLMLLRSGLRVVLAEKSVSLRREFHGEILQPGGQRILDELGVLVPARARGACVLDRFQVRERDRTLLDIDYRRLGGPYDHLLALPQPHLLAELLGACRALSGFTYLEGHRVVELTERRPGGPYAGAVLRGPAGGRVAVRAPVVVGADGRFSRTRALAGIGAGRSESFAQDVVWCALDAPGRATGAVRVHRAGGSAVLVHDAYPDRLRIGWTLPHGGWSRAVARGIGAIRDELAAVLPELADLVRAQLTSLSQLTLLDVFAAQATRWWREGVVLIGDAAHTHGPIGAQGINLALQDAAVLHPLLVRGQPLERYAAERAPVAARIHRMQVMQARAMLGPSAGPVASYLRAGAASLVTRTPIGAKLTRTIAQGPVAVRVRTELFVAATAAR